MDNINNITATVNKLFKDKTESEKQNIIDYIIKEQTARDNKGRFNYELTEGYKQAETLIDALSYNHYNAPEYNGNYQGERLACRSCKYCNRANTNSRYNCNKLKDKYNIDIAASKSNDICKYYKPYIIVTDDRNKYNSIGDYLQDNERLLCRHTIRDWKKQKYKYVTFEDYLHFLNNEYYVDYKGESTVNNKWNYLYINDYMLEVHLTDDWFNMDFIKDNKIYVRAFKGKREKKTKTLIVNDCVCLNEILKEV